MFTSEELARQNLASKITQLMPRWTRVNRVFTQYLDFPARRQKPPKDNHEESVSEIQRTSQHQKNQSVHEVGRFRKGD